jgi:hypothetical protein
LVWFGKTAEKTTKYSEFKKAVYTKKGNKMSLLEESKKEE